MTINVTPPLHPIVSVVTALAMHAETDTTITTTLAYYANNKKRPQFPPDHYQ